MRKAADPATNPTQTMRKVRCLLLRNKGEILSKSDDRAEESLELYQQALEIDGNDASLLNKMGSLVSSWPNPDIFLLAYKSDLLTHPDFWHTGHYDLQLHACSCKTQESHLLECVKFRASL